MKIKINLKSYYKGLFYVLFFSFVFFFLLNVFYKDQTSNKKTSYFVYGQQNCTNGVICRGCLNRCVSWSEFNEHGAGGCQALINKLCTGSGGNCTGEGGNKNMTGKPCCPGLQECMNGYCNQRCTRDGIPVGCASDGQPSNGRPCCVGTNLCSDNVCRINCNPGSTSPPSNGSTCYINYSGNSFTISQGCEGGGRTISVFRGSSERGCPTVERLISRFPARAGTYSPNPPPGECEQVDHDFGGIGVSGPGGVCTCNNIQPTATPTSTPTNILTNTPTPISYTVTPTITNTPTPTPIITTTGIYCYTCTPDPNDGDACERRFFPGLLACPPNTSTNPNGCAAALPSGKCQVNNPNTSLLFASRGRQLSDNLTLFFLASLVLGVILVVNGRLIKIYLKSCQIKN